MKICEVDISAPGTGLAGTRGPQVKLLQQSLEALGYSVGNTGIDGIYGPRTARAVRQFQRDAGITVDGDAGPETIQALKKEITAKKVDVKKIKQPSAPNKERAVLNMIADVESAGRYDAVYPNKRHPRILDMTFKELFKDMEKRGNAVGSSATGRYQYISKTLKGLVKEMGLDLDTKFTPEVQDKIALYHLKTQHGLNRWLTGKIDSEQFLNKLSKTWAGLPTTKTGSSYYAGVLDNRAGIDAGSALEVLDKIQGIV